MAATILRRRRQPVEVDVVTQAAAAAAATQAEQKNRKRTNENRVQYTYSKFPIQSSSSKEKKIPLYLEGPLHFSCLLVCHPAVPLRLADLLRVRRGGGRRGAQPVAHREAGLKMLQGEQEKVLKFEAGDLFLCQQRKNFFRQDLTQQRRLSLPKYVARNM